MKSHRKHAPYLPNEKVYSSRKGRLSGRLSPAGRKVRLDRLNAAIKDFWMYFEWSERDKADEANCKYKAQGHITRWGRCYHGWITDDGLKRKRQEMDKLWAEAVRDGIIPKTGI